MTTVGAKYIDAVKNTSLGYCITVFPLIAICYMFLLELRKVKLMHSCNHTEHYIK